MNGSVRANDGVELRYTQAGHGRPVVLVHGWCQSAAGWQHQIDGLAGRYRVIAYDQRGHGQSSQPAHGHTVHRLAADLQDLLAGLGLDGVVLAGTRWAARSPGPTWSCSAPGASPAWSSPTARRA